MATSGGSGQINTDNLSEVVADLRNQTKDEMLKALSGLKLSDAVAAAREFQAIRMAFATNIITKSGDLPVAEQVQIFNSLMPAIDPDTQFNALVQTLGNLPTG